MMKFFSPLLLAAVLFSGSAHADICYEEKTNLEKDIALTAHIFRGEVIAHNDKMPINAAGAEAPVSTVKVLEAWRGASVGDVFTIESLNSDEAGKSHAIVGQEYIILADTPNSQVNTVLKNKVLVDHCGHTRLLAASDENSGQDVLKAVRKTFKKHWWQ